MKILITGASGFIGGNIAKRLLQSGGNDIIGMTSSPVIGLKPSGITWVHGDLLQEVTLDKGVDFIVHCAALQDFNAMPSRTFIDANLAMTENIARYAKRAGIKGLVFASSISLHGDVVGEVVDEHTGRINPTLYGLSKHLCEILLREYQEYFSTVSLRLCGVVGPGAKNMWLSRVLARAERGDAIEIVNEDSLFNNLLHTDDLSDFLRTLMENGMSGFNAFPLASSNPMTIRDVVATIIEASSSSSRIIDKGNAGNSFTISSSFANEHFHFQPKDVATNLMKFVAENIR